MATNIPCYPIQQSHHPSIFYPTYHSSSQYYYPPPSQSSDMNNYYYNPTITYPNSQQIFPYGQSTSYYHPSTTHNNNNEQYKYYYNQQQQSSYTYASQTNSTNDIPVSNNPSFHRTYRQMSSNTQRLIYFLKYKKQKDLFYSFVFIELTVILNNRQHLVQLQRHQEHQLYLMQQLLFLLR